MASPSSPLFVRLLNKVARVIPSSTPYLIQFQKKVYRGLGTLDRYQAEWRNYNSEIPSGRDLSNCYSISYTILTYSLLYPHIVKAYYPLIKATFVDVLMMNLVRTSIINTNRREIGHAYYAIKSIREKCTGGGFVVLEKFNYILGEPRRELYFDEKDHESFNLQIKLLLKGFYQMTGVHGAPQKLQINSQTTMVNFTSEDVLKELENIRAYQQPFPAEEIKRYREMTLQLVKYNEEMKKHDLWLPYIVCTDQLRDWLYAAHPQFEYRLFHSLFFHVETALARLVLESLHSSNDKNNNNSSSRINSSGKSKSLLFDKWHVFESCTDLLLQEKFPEAALQIKPPDNKEKFVYSFVRSDIPVNESTTQVPPSIYSACLLSFIFSCPYSVLVGIVSPDVAFMKPPLVERARKPTAREQLSEQISATTQELSQKFDTLKSETEKKLEEISNSDSVKQLKAKSDEIVKSTLGKNTNEVMGELGTAGGKALAGVVFEKARDGSRKFVLNFINGYKSGLYSSLTVNLIDVFKKGVGKALVQADKAVEEGKRLEEKYKLKEQLASLASKTQDNLDKAKQIVSQKLSGGSVSDEDVDEFLKSEALASLHKYKDYLKEVNELYRAMYDDIKREKRENSKWKRLCESLRRECVPTNAEISQENAMLDFHASLSNEIVGNYLTPSNGLSVTEDKIVFQILSAIISEGGFPSGSVPDVSLLQLVFNKKVREEVRRTQVPGCVEVIKQAALGVIVGKPFLDSEPMLDNPFNAVEEKLKEMAASVVSNVTTQGTQLASDVQANIQSKLDDSRDKMKTATETLASNSTLQSKLSTAKTHISSMSTQIESMAKDLKEQAQKNPPTATE